MQKQILAALLGAALAMPLAAQAEGSYVKLGVGQSEYKNGIGNENETAASLAYGFSFDKNFGVEVGYINFGKYKGQRVDDVLKANPGYFGWMQNGDFSLNTKKVLSEIKLRNAFNQ